MMVMAGGEVMAVWSRAAVAGGVRRVRRAARPVVSEVAMPGAFTVPLAASFPRAAVREAGVMSVSVVSVVFAAAFGGFAVWLRFPFRVAFVPAAWPVRVRSPPGRSHQQGCTNAATNPPRFHFILLSQNRGDPPPERELSKTEWIAAQVAYELLTPPACSPDRVAGRGASVTCAR
jgi:hypothetical protein